MPRMIDLIRASALPANLMQAAAKGALSVPPREMIEILVHLASHNKVFGETAKLTLAGWDVASSRAVASEPGTPKEVLDYLIDPRNLRLPVLPALLENHSIRDETLVELSASASREVVETLLKSERINNSPNILNSLHSNPNLTGIELTSIRSKLAAAGFAPSSQAAKSGADEVLLEAPLNEAAGPDEVLDEGLAAYLNEHADEISTEADKPFQLIGGFYDEFVPGSEEPLGEAETTSATATAASAVSAAAARKALVKKTHLSHEEERGSALQKISKLDIKGRIQTAMKGTKEERSLLIRDGTKVVALAVLESPKISDGEVEKFASQKNVLEAVLRAIPMKRRFAKHYAIVRNLVFNPRTPLDVSLGLLKHLLIHDLRNLSGNKEVSETVRKLALKMFKQKMDTSKKSTD
jgi:hypothetical protein